MTSFRGTSGIAGGSGRGGCAYLRSSIYVYIYIYIYIYIYTHMCIHIIYRTYMYVYIYIYIYTYLERDRYQNMSQAFVQNKFYIPGEPQINIFCYCFVVHAPQPARVYFLFFSIFFSGGRQEEPRESDEREGPGSRRPRRRGGS